MRRSPRTPIERAIDQATGEVRNPRQAKYVAKRNRVGLRRIAVWVPIEREEEFKRMAREGVAAFLGIEGDAE